jgi:hypothetical protein
MRKIKIGYDHKAEQRATISKHKQIDTLQKVEKYLSKYNIPVNQEKLVKEGFENYLNRLFSETYSGKFPEYLAIDERLKFAQIDPEPLRVLQKEYNSNYNNQTDFNIYATTKEELTRYTVLTNLLEAWNEFLNTNPPFEKRRVERELMELIEKALTKNEEGKLTVNLYGYVLNENLNHG